MYYPDFDDDDEDFQISRVYFIQKGEMKRGNKSPSMNEEAMFTIINGF